MEIIILVYMIAVNVIAFIMCVYDKRAAIKRRSRISEKALFIISFIGGAAGILAGMLLARHKIRKWYFMLFIPLFLACHALLIIVLL